MASQGNKLCYKNQWCMEARFQVSGVRVGVVGNKTDCRRLDIWVTDGGEQIPMNIEDPSSNFEF